MADVITRFKLETSQYDSKLRDTVKNLKEVVHMNELAGKDFREFSDAAIQAARGLGQTATGATNAKDKVKELVAAYNDMAKTYNEMSEAMKKSEGGKALAASLQELQGRIKEAKAEMNATPGVLDKLASKFVINVDAIKLFNMGLNAAEAALSVAKDAFFNNEAQLDDWGRTVESSKSLYTGFLDALNTGDISGYLQRIDEITKAARAAYDAMDALNTYNAFNQINVEKTRTGMTESIADYRSGQGSKESVRAAGAAYQKELRERQKMERDAYRAAVSKIAAERGANANDLMMALSGSYGSYQSLKAIPMSGRRLVNVGGGMFGGGTTYEAEYAANRQEKLGAALRRLNDTELQSLQALGAQAERTGNEIAQVDKQLTRVLNGRQPGVGGGTTTSHRSVGSSLNIGFDVNKAGLAAERGVDTMPSVWAMMNLQSRKPYDLGKDISTEWRVNNKGELTTDKSDKAVKTLSDELKKNSGVISGLAGGLNSITSGIEAMGFDLPDEIDEMINGISGLAQIISGVGSIIELFGTTSQTANTIAVNANTATMVGLIDALTVNSFAKMVPFMARGGVVPKAAAGYLVPGNSMSGDNVFAGHAWVNSGELILNKSSQDTLAAQLENSGMQNLHLEAVVTGSQIKLALKNDDRLQGGGSNVIFKS